MVGRPPEGVPSSEKKDVEFSEKLEWCLKNVFEFVFVGDSWKLRGTLSLRLPLRVTILKPSEESSAFSASINEPEDVQTWRIP